MIQTQLKLDNVPAQVHYWSSAESTERVARLVNRYRGLLLSAGAPCGSWHDRVRLTGIRLPPAFLRTSFVSLVVAFHSLGETRVKDLPFSTYDLLGYLASGLAVLGAIQLATGALPLFGHEHGALESTAIFLAAYVVGQVVAALSKPVLEDGIVHKFLGAPSVNLLSSCGRGLSPRLFPGYFKPLPESVRQRVIDRAAGEGSTATGEALFLHVRFRDEIRKDESLMKRLDVFLAQYGFARNMAFALLAIGLTLLVCARFIHRANLPLYAVLSLTIGAGMWFRYLKFFRQYSYELFNCYAGGANASAR